MAGNPKAFQDDAFQNDAFQTGGAVTATPRRRLLPTMKVGFMWLFSLLLWR